jgi:guanylate kinase
LETRLRGRGTETEEKIQIRLRNAIDELAYGKVPGNFDAYIVNNDLQKTVEEVTVTLQSWYPDIPLSD